MTNRALLDPTTLPPFPAITPAAIGPALDTALAERDAAIDRLVTDRPTGFADAWLPLERAETTIDALWSSVSHLHGVVDDADLRAAYAASQGRLVKNSMAMLQNQNLYAMFTNLAATPQFPALPDADRVAVERLLRSATLAGVALDPAARRRFTDISIELSKLATGFGSAVLDATDAWCELVEDAAVLRGLSDADMAMLAAAAKASGKDGWLVTLQQPSVNAVLTFAEDRALRSRVYRAYGTRASDQGPNGGQFDNSGRMARILELRREAASLLGYPDHVALSLETRMASNGSEILAFLRDLAKRARPTAEREVAALRDLARTELGIDDLQPWDVAFVADHLRRAEFAIDQQAVRAYFPIDRVVAGWRGLLTRLFGISLTKRDDVALWHPDAAYYDVADQDGIVFAGLYLDLHARPGKRGGAWMAPARPRLKRGDVVNGPIAYLVCNFAPESERVPALLSHDDIVTLLHETGHVLHHLFTRVDRPSIAGINGFEWDAIELPSQLLEDFAWDRAVLTSMSGHVETGLPLPPDLFDKLIRARHFMSGISILRQIEFAMFDLLLHLGTSGSDPVTVLEAVRHEIAVLRPPAWHRFPHAFSHIFASGYAAGYYGYLWAEVLAADGFQRFADAGLVDRATGEAFREEVLSRGATRPAADSFRAFRGRDADPTAFLTRHGLL